MRKRDLLRHVPGFSKHIRRLEALEARVTDSSNVHLTSHNARLASHNARLMSENQQLRELMHQLLFAGDIASVAEASPTPKDRFPIPAGALRFLVAGTLDAGGFIQTGRECAETVRLILDKQSLAPSQFKRVLDFGCGCGRVLRHLKAQFRGEVHGTDPNSTAVRWCEKHLGGFFAVNAPEPPLAYGSEMFDFAYAFSILTHLAEPLQIAWMQELRRVLVPGGYLLVTVHGAKMAARMLDDASRQRFQQGEMVVYDEKLSGSNYCATYHPHEHVRTVLAKGFEVVEFMEGDYGIIPPQDAYLLRRHG